MERPQDNQVIEISNLTTYQQNGHIETQQFFLKTTQGWLEQQQQQSHACRETFNSNMQHATCMWVGVEVNVIQ
jgi:hypothetical protein